MKGCFQEEKQRWPTSPDRATGSPNLNEGLLPEGLRRSLRAGGTGSRPCLNEGLLPQEQRPWPQAADLHGGAPASTKGCSRRSSDRTRGLSQSVGSAASTKGCFGRSSDRPDFSRGEGGDGCLNEGLLPEEQRPARQPCPRRVGPAPASTKGCSQRGSDRSHRGASVSHGRPQRRAALRGAATGLRAGRRVSHPDVPNSRGRHSSRGVSRGVARRGPSCRGAPDGRHDRRSHPAAGAKRGIPGGLGVSVAVRGNDGHHRLDRGDDPADLDQRR